MNVNKININQSESSYYIASDIYDVSYHNSGTTFESLSALLNDSNLSTLIPIAVRCGGMSIRFIQSLDNKYVQYRLMSNEFTTDTTQWAIADEGVYVENPEYVYVKCDGEDKLLWAIRKDGTVYYAAGIPNQIISYIEKLRRKLSLDISDINLNISDINSGLSKLNDLGIYLMDEVLMDLVIDSENKILEKRLPDGSVISYTKYSFKDGVDILDESTYPIESIEYLSAKVDLENKILWAIRKDGTVYIPYLDSPKFKDIESKIRNNLVTINNNLSTINNRINTLEAKDYFHFNIKQ